MAEGADRPIIARGGDNAQLDAMGRVFGLAEWMGSGPAQLHVHHDDDEAWHVLEGSVEFRFADGVRETVGPGATVFVPAGVAHTYVTSDNARYLIVLTPQIEALIAELHELPPSEHADAYRRHASELLEL